MAESNEEKHDNWLRVIWGLLYVREGLQSYVDEKGKEQYQTLLNNINPTCNFRDEMKREIQQNHGKKKPFWLNTNKSKWQDPHVGYWEVTKCYLSTSGYKDNMRANDVDASGLLSICINSSFINNNFLNKQHLEEVRNIRNSLLHDANYAVEGQTADECLNKMIAVLEDPKELIHDKCAKRAAYHIKKIKAKAAMTPIIMDEALQRCQQINVPEEQSLEEIERKTYDRLQHKKLDARLKEIEDGKETARHSPPQRVRTYQMKNEPFGKLLIFYNTKCGSMQEIKSCEQDAFLMKKTFEGKFDSVCFANKSLQQMKTELSSIETHVTDGDTCLMCYFSSHGSEDGVVTADDKILLYSDIEKAFRNDTLLCMNGKPKIIVLDCCRGSEEHKFSPKAPIAKSRSGSSQLQSKKIHSDMAIFKSSPEGYISYAPDKDPAEPSYFTSAFCKAFRANPNGDYTDIVIDTTAELEDFGPSQQCVPESITYLKKRIFFKSFEKYAERF